MLKITLKIENDATGGTSTAVLTCTTKADAEAAMEAVQAMLTSAYHYITPTPDTADMIKLGTYPTMTTADMIKLGTAEG